MSDELEGKVSDKQDEYRILRVNLESMLAQSQCILGRPLMPPIYRWPGPEKPIGFDINYNTSYNIISYFNYDYTWAYFS
jgi:hypothetical protein